MTEYIIETKNLTKRFGKDIAVNSINMKIERGENIWITWQKWSWKNYNYVHASKSVRTNIR